jgi:3-phosphoshikimate 1-carboxyvinyltransferase
MPDVPVLRILPLATPPHATIRVLGSKSISNRAVVCAALAGGESVLGGFGFSDDTEAMLECASRLGAAVVVDRARASVTVTGTNGQLRPGPIELDARLAGTTSRFVTALVALGRGSYRIDGESPLRARPMRPLHDALAALGCTVRAQGRPGHLPVVVETQGLRGGRVSIPGDVSSQFLTALMLVAPATPGGIEIDVTTPQVSRPYLAITAVVMAAFGARGVIVEPGRVSVPPGRYAPTAYEIEPDASSASYLWAAAAITGGRVRVPGFAASPLQGDVAFVDLLARMGTTAARDGDGIEVRGTGVVRGVEADMAACSDLVPTLAAVAAFADSPTRITGVGFIRRKETDRIGSLVAELRRCGVEADEEPDGLTVRPVPGAPRATRVRTYHDHRMAMAFALVGLRVAGIEIEDPAVVTKSYPGYWTALDALRST